MVVRFVYKEKEMATRFYETFVPCQGETVTVIGQDYKIARRVLDVDENEVKVLLEDVQ